MWGREIHPTPDTNSVCICGMTCMHVTITLLWCGPVLWLGTVRAAMHELHQLCVSTSHWQLTAPRVAMLHDMLLQRSPPTWTHAWPRLPQPASRRCWQPCWAHHVCATALQILRIPLMKSTDPPGFLATDLDRCTALSAAASAAARTSGHPGRRRRQLDCRRGGRVCVCGPAAAGSSVRLPPQRAQHGIQAAAGPEHRGRPRRGHRGADRAAATAQHRLDRRTWLSRSCGRERQMTRTTATPPAPLHDVYICRTSRHVMNHLARRSRA